MALLCARGSLIPELARPIFAHILFASDRAGGCPQVSDGYYPTQPDSDLCPHQLGEVWLYTHQPESCQAPAPPAPPSAHTETWRQEVMSDPPLGKVGAQGKDAAPGSTKGQGLSQVSLGACCRQTGHPARCWHRHIG